jgi:hypothetical protein
MKKLQKKLKNVPTNASLVCSSTNSSLNKDESPSAKSGKNLVKPKSSKRICNTPEENLLQHTGGQNLVSVIVYVLGMSGQPLMPSSPRNVRRLLKSGKAKVVKRFPFTIQMLKPTGKNKQEITLGIDVGYARIGYSCVTEKKELMSGEVKLENGTKERLTERRMYRRLKRSKLWYREPRFNNRKRKEGWLPPSIRRRYDEHVFLIKSIKKLLPITETIVEIGNFDTQKLINPDIQGTEYQQGNLYESNLRGFIIAREKGKCQFCGKEKGSGKWRFHHIESRADGGTDRPANIALLHEKCHHKIHEKHLESKIKKNKSYKESTFMSIIKNRFQKELDCRITYGYVTYNKARELGLEKSHINDAFVIAGGNHQERCVSFEVIQKRKNNRSLQLNKDGLAPSIRRGKSKYQPHDLVKINGKMYSVVGMFNLGTYIRVKGLKNKEVSNFPIKKVESGFSYNSLVFKSIFPIEINCKNG